MLGFILTGHGSYASGLMGALEMIAGPQQQFIIVPFENESGLQKFEKDMTNAISDLCKQNDGVIIFSDIIGGTPFKVAMTQSMILNNVTVITGTNLPLLIEATLLRLESTDSKIIADNLVEIASKSISVGKIEIQSSEDINTNGI